MSTFNVDAFLNTQYTDALDTALIPPDEGEYLAITGTVSAENFRTYDIKKGVRAGTQGHGFDLQMILQDDVQRAKLGREPTVRWSSMLEMTPDGMAIDFGPGKNVKLGALRKALGQNESGKPWTFGMLSGQLVRIKVKHRVDPQDSSRVFAEVVSTAKP